MWKPSFGARRPSKSESRRCENQAFVRDFPSLCCGMSLLWDLFAVRSLGYEISLLWDLFGKFVQSYTDFPALHAMARSAPNQHDSNIFKPRDERELDHWFVTFWQCHVGLHTRPFLPWPPASWGTLGALHPLLPQKCGRLDAAMISSSDFHRGAPHLLWSDKKRPGMQHGHRNIGGYWNKNITYMSIYSITNQIYIYIYLVLITWVGVSTPKNGHRIYMDILHFTNFLYTLVN